jgi:uncharacterized membrane protein YsdA (DUF1294 family)
MRRAKGAPSVILAGAYIVLLVLAALLGRAPWLLTGIVGFVSLLTYIAYGWDKSAAQQGARRTPESTLHAMALAGGWPGAAVAQEKFRHKTSKASFRAGYWATVVMNCLLMGWLLTSAPGQALLWTNLPV